LWRIHLHAQTSRKGAVAIEQRCTSVERTPRRGCTDPERQEAPGLAAGGPPANGPGESHDEHQQAVQPAIDAWRSTWIEPVNGRVRRFMGRSCGDGIVLLSDEADPQLRWRFTDITADSFAWRAETSRDGGATWHFDEQMLGHLG
jgi:hypothetical protein